MANEFPCPECPNPGVCRRAGKCMNENLLTRIRKGIMGNKPTATQTRKNIRGKKMQDGSILSQINFGGRN